MLAAASNGTTGTYWASVQPDRVALYSQYGDRTFAEVDAHANQLVARAARPRRAGGRRPRAAVRRTGPSSSRSSAAAQRSGMRLTTVNWHLTGEEAGLHRRRLRSDRVRRGRAVRRPRPRKPRRLAPRLKAKIAIGGDIPGFERWDDVLGEHDGAPLDDPALGGTMLYTSGTTGRPKGVRRVADGAARARSLAIASRYDRDAHVHLCTGPLYHAAPLAFSLAAPAAMGVPIVLMDGWDAEETLALIEQAPRHAHAHGADDVPPACCRCPTT